MKLVVASLIIFVTLGTLRTLGAEGDDKSATFATSLKDKNYHQALLLWPQSPEARSNSSTGQALLAFALYKDGMPLLGFNKLLAINNLGRLSPMAKSLWKNELNVNSPFWRNARVQWNKKLTAVLPSANELALTAWSLHDLKTEKEIKNAQSLLRSLEGTDPGAWVKWQLALAYGLNDRTSLAVDYLQSLVDSDQHAVGQDAVLMAAARMLYQDNKLDLAMKYYNQVPKISDYWLEALEERAWIYAKLNDFERTLGEMKTILNPAFVSQVGPESYFLATLADLRLCDYYSIFKILKDFKGRNETRLVEIQKLADTGHNKTSDQALVKLEQGIKSWAQLGPDLDKVPRFVNRDEILSRAVSRQKIGHNQLAQIQNLAGENSYFRQFVSETQSASKDGERAAPLRLQALAKEDVAEMKRNLLKLQLVESEAIHRMHVGQTFAQSRKSLEQDKIKDPIDFPYEENEVWMDELGHYQANAKGCPVSKPTGTVMAPEGGRKSL